MTWTIRKILFLIILTFSIGMIGTLLWASITYQRFTSDTLTSATGGIVENLVYQQIENHYQQDILPFVKEWVGLSTLVKGIQEKSHKNLMLAANRMFNTIEVTNGIVDLQNVVIYDNQMNFVTMASLDIVEGLYKHSNHIDRMRSRTKGEQRIGSRVLWKTSKGQPVLSTVTSIGGFRLLGFIEFVTRPILALEKMGDAVGGDFVLRNKDGDILIKSEPSVHLKPQKQSIVDAIVDEAVKRRIQNINVVIHGTDGSPWAFGTISRDMSTFVEAEKRLQVQAVLVVATISLVAFALAWLLLNFSVFKRITSFAKNLEELARGNTKLFIPPTGGDEFGTMRGAMEKLCLAVQENQELQLKSETELLTRKKMEEELRISMIKAEAANRAKSEFLANMSHELRTPLNAIIGFSDIMRSEILGPIKPVHYAGYALDIYNSGHHLLEIITTILDMSKIEAGKHIVFIERVDFNLTCEEALVMVKGRAEKEHITLESRLEEPSPTVMADKAITRQIILNLLTNALKFTPEGGAVSISTRVEDLKLFVVIKDTGIGMDAEGLERAVLPFVQVEREKGRSHEGTGLGLPLTKKFIDMQNGSFQLNSEVGVGTTAIFTLPLAITYDSDEPLISPDTLAWLPSMSVGVREWDADHRHLMELIKKLGSLTPETSTQEDVEKALNALSEYTNIHLRSEEMVMKRLEYTGFVAHREAHDQFRQWFKEQHKLWLKDPAKWDVHAATEYLVNWLYAHILTVDMEYKNFFEGRHQGVLAALYKYEGVSRLDDRG